MVELSFLKSGSKYICEFEVSSDFNLHIEREKGGYLYLYQRSSEGGNYDSVGDAKFAPQDLVVDYDCSALVYPKYIKIVSEVEPSYAAITTDGEVTEIKSQTKEVEITANGTTQVAPDAGYSYLTGVTVKTNVPQSGGSGEGLKVEYLDLTNVKSDTMPLAALIGTMAYCVKVEIGGSKKIVSPNALLSEIGIDTVLTLPFYACEINFDAIYGVNMDGTYAKPKDIILTLGLSQSDVDAIPRLTKEEFYTI